MTTIIDKRENFGKENMTMLSITWQNGIFEFWETPHAYIIYLFIYILLNIKVSLCWLSNYKNKKLKTPLDLDLDLSDFKGTIVVLIYILIVYYFFISDQIPNCFSTDIIITKKNHCKNTKISPDVILFFFRFQEYFNHFTVQLIWKKTYVPDQFYNDK